jgi:hypothetical protein
VAWHASTPVRPDGSKDQGPELAAISPLPWRRCSTLLLQKQRERLGEEENGWASGVSERMREVSVG